MPSFDPLSPLFAAACLLAALATARVLMAWHGAPTEGGRFASIDGLRGFLAFAVFIHHASIWYFYLRDGVWTFPPSNLYRHLGEASVGLFFMITAFLFIHKITGPSTIVWRTLFLHRLFRLAPLYLLAMAGLLAMVACLAGWQAIEPVSKVVIQSLRWIVFNIGGNPDINGVKPTAVLIATVPWSLQYEWAFYLSLPLIAAALGRKVSMTVLAGCAVLIALVSIKLPEGGRFFPAFVGGAVAAYAVQRPALCRFARSKAGSATVIVLALAVVRCFDSAYQPGAMVLLAVVLTLVACGADLFGILTRPTAFFFGEASYSLYLLHPLLLSWTFKVLLPRSGALLSRPLFYWGVILVLTPVLVWLCVTTYRWIERPGIAAGRRVDAWMRERKTDPSTTTAPLGRTRARVGA